MGLIILKALRHMYQWWNVVNGGSLLSNLVMRRPGVQIPPPAPYQTARWRSLRDTRILVCALLSVF